MVILEERESVLSSSIHLIDTSRGRKDQAFFFFFFSSHLFPHHMPSSARSLFFCYELHLVRLDATHNQMGYALELVKSD